MFFFSTILFFLSSDSKMSDVNQYLPFFLSPFIILSINIPSFPNIPFFPNIPSFIPPPAASPVSLGFSSFSPSLTSSEDEDDEVGLKSRPAGGVTRWRRLGAVAETGNSGEDEEEDVATEEERKTNGSRSEGETGGEGEEGPWRFKDFGKEFEPLKSVQLLKNLRSLSLYLPAHSIASDTDTGEM